MKANSIFFNDENVNVEIKLGGFSNKFYVNGEKLKDNGEGITTEKFIYSIEKDGLNIDYLIVREFPLIGSESITIHRNGKLVLKLAK
jgi:hypothetical protein